MTRKGSHAIKEYIYFRLSSFATDRIATLQVHVLLTSRDPQKLEKFDSSMWDDTVENNIVIKIPRS